MLPEVSTRTAVAVRVFGRLIPGSLKASKIAAKLTAFRINKSRERERRQERAAQMNGRNANGAKNG
jgi:hypothetical protein